MEKMQNAPTTWWVLIGVGVALLVFQAVLISFDPGDLASIVGLFVPVIVMSVSVVNLRRIYKNRGRE